MRTILGLGTGLIACCTLLVSVNASAQQCETDGDCAAGHACELVEQGGCSQGPCDPGGNCPPPVCETEEVGYCVRAACATDADCGGDMVCHEQSYVTCSDSAGCEPGTECPPPKEEACQTSTEKSCAYRYELPCQDDADCGGGFSCVQETGWQCDASGPTDGGVGTPPRMTDPSEPSEKPEPNCYPVPSSQRSCQLIEVACDSDADCAAGLSCQQRYASCGGSGEPDSEGREDDAGSDDATDPAAPAPAPGPMAPDGCTPVAATVCAPPGYYEGTPGSNGGESDAGAGSAGDGDDEDTDEGPSDPEPEAPPAEGEEEDDGNPVLDLLHKLCTHGCSVNGMGQTGGDLSWLIVVGALALQLRTRRRSN